MRVSGWADAAPLLVPPPPDLDGWLSAGVAVQLETPPGSHRASRFPAILSSAIVVVTQGRFGFQDGTAFHALPAAFASGPSMRPVTLRHAGVLRHVGVMVRPAAAAALLGPAGPWVGRIADAREAFGEEWPAVHGQVCESGADAALGALFDFVRRRAAGARNAAMLEHALRLQRASLLGVMEAARQHGCSPRQFERRFAAAFGLPPKRFYRLARAEVAMRVALARGRCDAALAAELGYFDQSHLGRDLRELAGLTPSELTRMPSQGDASWWPLRIGAAYPQHGVRADFAGEQASLFS